MSASPLVSVLIPCFNAAQYVGAAIESVLAQTYSPIEVIVVDDGSTDGSAKVLDAFRRRGVTVITQANGGQCAAANLALAASKGELIKFFDADDLLAPDMIERQVARLGSRRS
jgi:glycosyltransferase involved in cell wall biosynthesis